MIELINVTKKYFGTKAVNNLSLNISNNGIYCLLGRNGAGKTTIMKLITGRTYATSGRVTVNGRDVSSGSTPDCVSYIESGAVQFNMKIPALIEAAAALQSNFDYVFAQEMVRRFNLNPNKRYNDLSLGMKTVFAAIIGLANNSKVILLDEPMLGVDAIMRSRFNDMLAESYTANPRIIIVSTHLIDEIAKMTERLIIIDRGKLILETGIDDIDEHAYTLIGSAESIVPLLDGLNCIGKATAGSIMSAHIYGDRINPPSGVTVDRLSLQDFFINIVGGNGHE